MALSTSSTRFTLRTTPLTQPQVAALAIVFIGFVGIGTVGCGKAESPVAVATLESPSGSATPGSAGSGTTSPSDNPGTTAKGGDTTSTATNGTTTTKKGTSTTTNGSSGSTGTDAAAIKNGLLATADLPAGNWKQGATDTSKLKGSAADPTKYAACAPFTEAIQRVDADRSAIIRTEWKDAGTKLEISHSLTAYTNPDSVATQRTALEDPTYLDCVRESITDAATRSNSGPVLEGPVEVAAIKLPLSADDLGVEHVLGYSIAYTLVYDGDTFPFNAEFVTLGNGRFTSEVSVLRPGTSIDLAELVRKAAAKMPAA